MLRVSTRRPGLVALGGNVVVGGGLGSGHMAVRCLRTGAVLAVLGLLSPWCAVAATDGIDKNLVDPLPNAHEADHQKRFTQLRTWVFLATSDASAEWANMTRRAVVSAIERTSLKPVCVFWGDRRSPLAQWLEAADVDVLYHVPKWYDLVAKSVETNAGHNVQYSPLYGSARSLASTFLRVDIPLLLDPKVYGDLVLYTDTDVLFLGDFDRAVFDDHEPPDFFMFGVERDTKPGETITYGNAGVMLLNLVGLRRTYADFIDWIFGDENLANGLHFGNYGPGDQGAFQSFYRGKFDVINWPRFNWRPYWPYDPEFAALLHFHGPKPKDYVAYLNAGDVLTPLYGYLLDICNHAWHPWRTRKKPDHCRRWIALYDCAPMDLPRDRRDPPSPDCVARGRRNAIRRARHKHRPSPATDV